MNRDVLIGGIVALITWLLLPDILTKTESAVLLVTIVFCFTMMMEDWREKHDRQR